jgi:16S rRNA (guanine966-N2)-methyltransferase
LAWEALCFREWYMRIIAGRFKGKKLSLPRDEVRPTTDRLRESLFNVLGERVPGSRWVDAFAGSGAIGIEALSRGARLVIFNDKDFHSRKLLSRNLELCGVTEGYDVLDLDSFTLFNTLSGMKADYVFLDPPYKFGRYEKLLDKVASSIVLGPESLVVLEVFKKTEVELESEQWQLARKLEAGDSVLLLLKPVTPVGG